MKKKKNKVKILIMGLPGSGKNLFSKKSSKITRCRMVECR